MTATDQLIQYAEKGYEFQVNASVDDGDDTAGIEIRLDQEGLGATRVLLPLNVADLDDLIAGLIRTRTALAVELAMQERDA